MNALTDGQFWKAIWSTSADLSRYDNEKWVYRNYTYRRFHDVCRRHLNPDPAKTLLDVGCGVGDWSVYFHRVYGYAITALDASPEAIAQARENFARQRIAAKVVAEDFFAHAGAYDVIYAGGFLEHFKDPGPVLAKMCSLLNDGGTLINWIPNLEGRTGALLRRFDPGVFETHNVLADDVLMRCHAEAGFSGTTVCYDGAICLNMVSRKGLNRGARAALKVAAKGTNLLCLGFRHLFYRMENRLLSPFKIIVATKGSR
ncbi:MAG: methyltransferase domain-containing protein [Phycisphaerae bacterium]|nr:methyltransferase domain-containing protein [Phycisphaerae bacterium]